MNFYERFDEKQSMYYSSSRRPQGNLPMQLVAMSCMIGCIALLMYFME